MWQADPAGAGTTLQGLLAGGGEPDAPLSKPRVRPLWWAVAWGRCPEVFELLLEAGASPDGCVADAVYHGLDDFVRALVDRGADLEERTPGGLTSLLHALVFKRYGSVELLLRLGADTSATTSKGYDALGVATATKAPQSVISLLS
jgi:ankyrin repeat protein